MSKTLREKLIDSHIHPTSQRLALAGYLFHESDHPTADDVYAWAKRNLARVSLATVYNTLNKFVAAGLIREFRFPHTDRIVYDHNVDEHFHVYDSATDRLADLHKEDVEVRFRKSFGGKVKDFQLFVFGSIGEPESTKKHEHPSSKTPQKRR